MMGTGYGHSIIQSIYSYNDKLDDDDIERIINALETKGNFNNIKKLIDKTLEGEDTPDNLSIISYSEENEEILKDQVMEALDKKKTVIVGKQEDIDKIIDSL